MPPTLAASPEQGDRRYISTVMDAPILEREYEAELALRWREKTDQKALDVLITSHIRLVVRMAAKFRGYGLPMADLIQEGNTGLLEAANRFDVERKVRFSTYASWWILAAIQDYVVRNASIVRIGTTPAQKSLFFNLRRMRAQLSGSTAASMTDADRRAIAERLGVPLAAVERMEAHLSFPDRSLNASVLGDDGDEAQDFLPDLGPSPERIVQERHDDAVLADWLRAAIGDLTPREQQVIARRFLNEDKTTLAEIGETFGVTKERIRQIESKALAKLRRSLSERTEIAEMSGAGCGGASMPIQAARR